MDTRENLLVIGPDPALFETLKDSPVSNEFQLFYCGIQEDLPVFVREHEIRFAFLDTQDGAFNASEILATLKRFDRLLNVIVFGCPIHPEEVLEWINRGADDYLEIPVSSDALRAALKKALEKRDLRRETFLLERRLEKKYNFHGLLSKIPYMLDIFGIIENIARHFTSVLIIGDTGTGKEMAARAIHALSETKNRRLIVCDCTSIPETLFESELFGYVRGAFTGADQNKRGLFEEAHEGVIFLDEIGEIPLPIQAKLLRVLENRQFRPLGSNEVKYVNVRVIAATNRDLAEACRKGTFREDLYHRLNRVEIHIPPLRERPEDLPLLVRHFLDANNKAFDKLIKGVSREVQKVFLKYDWPGNVRELENVLQSAAMLTKKDFIDVGDLPKNLRDQAAVKPRPSFVDKENLSTLDDLEKEYIAYLLKLTRFNLKRTAKILNISRTTLYNKMGRYGLVREPRPKKGRPSPGPVKSSSSVLPIA
jgi:DNA-binding NtrC family response regulator